MPSNFDVNSANVSTCDIFKTLFNFYLYILKFDTKF